MHIATSCMNIPETARSWTDPEMLSLHADSRVDIAVSDQCEYGLVTPDHTGKPTPCKKPTKWASSSPRLLDRLRTRCSGKRIHQHLVGGRAKDATLYPLPLKVEILRGMRDESDHKHYRHDADEIALNAACMVNSHFPPPTPTHKSNDAAEKLASENKTRTSTVRFPDGTQKIVTFDGNAKNSYKDEYTQKTFDHELTQKAIIDNLQCFNERVCRSLPSFEAKRLHPPW